MFMQGIMDRWSTDIKVSSLNKVRESLEKTRTGSETSNIENDESYMDNEMYEKCNDLRVILLVFLDSIMRFKQDFSISEAQLIQYRNEKTVKFNEQLKENWHLYSLDDEYLDDKSHVITNYKFIRNMMDVFTL
jgi:hypothetical protein